jgi:hypothetical protein
VHLYAIGGIGGDYRRIALTQTVAYGGIVCDPWWGFCGTGFYPGGVVVSHDETTRFAWTAGLGLDMALGGRQSWFVEARFEELETGSPTQFVPIRVGIRF